MFREVVYRLECLDESLNISQVFNVQNPSIAVSSLRPYIYKCKFIRRIYQCQQNNKKTVFVIENLGTAIWRGLNLHVFLPSMAPMQLGKFHRSQKSFTICDQFVRVGVGITSYFKCFDVFVNCNWVATRWQ
jgi:hypothetical protein